MLLQYLINFALSHNRPKAVYKRRASEVQRWIQQTAVRAQIPGQICCAACGEAVALQRYQSKYTFIFQIYLLPHLLYSKHIFEPSWVVAFKQKVSPRELKRLEKGVGSNCLRKQKKKHCEKEKLQLNSAQTHSASFPRRHVRLTVPNLQIKEEK